MSQKLKDAAREEEDASSDDGAESVATNTDGYVNGLGGAGARVLFLCAAVYGGFNSLVLVPTANNVCCRQHTPCTVPRHCDRRESVKSRVHRGAGMRKTRS